eukprot:SAG11_NODE_8137_length_1056_cov_1.272727_2_plen_56_part_01
MKVPANHVGVLCEKLEEKMKNTEADGLIAELFEGKMQNYIKCVDVDFASVREESFC